MSIWGDNLVVVRSLNIQIYSKPTSFASPSHLRTIPFDYIAWDATFLYRSALTASRRWILPSTVTVNDDAKLHFFAIHQSIITLYSLGLGAPLLDGETFTEQLTLHSISHCNWDRQWDRPSWKFLPGATGHRLTWISEGPFLGTHQPPTLFASTLGRSSSCIEELDNAHDNLVKQAIDIGDPNLLPATWAMPRYDFDEALGILVFGNSFGEVALCDYVRLPVADIWGIADDFVTQDAGDTIRLPQVCLFIFVYLPSA